LSLGLKSLRLQPPVCESDLKASALEYEWITITPLAAGLCIYTLAPAVTLYCERTQTNCIRGISKSNMQWSPSLFISTLFCLNANARYKDSDPQIK